MTTTTNDTPLTEAKNLSDYYFNNSGTINEIKSYNKAVYCLFITGSGIDGASYSYYNLYQVKNNLLVKIGEASENVTPEAIDCKFTLNGQNISINGFTIDQIFKKMEKRS
jgi:hypothetical protein